MGLGHNQRFVTVCFTDYFTIEINEHGDLLACGNNENGQLGSGGNRDRFEKVHIQGLKCMHISCTYNYTFVIDESESLWSCGFNNYS